MEFNIVTANIDEAVKRKGGISIEIINLKDKLYIKNRYKYTKVIKINLKQIMESILIWKLIKRCKINMFNAKVRVFGKVQYLE